MDQPSQSSISINCKWWFFAYAATSTFSFPRSSKTLRSSESKSVSSTISCSASSSSTWANASVCARGLRWCLLWFDCYLRLIRNHSIFPLGFLNTRSFYMAEVGQKASASPVGAVECSSCHLFAQLWLMAMVNKFSLQNNRRKTKKSGKPHKFWCKLFKNCEK